MKRPLAALIVESAEDDAKLLVEELRRGGFDLVYERVEHAAAMRGALADRAWDIVLSGYTMPHFSGLEALKVLRESAHDVPAILVSDVAGEEACVEAMRGGAHDYLRKGELGCLVAKVEGALRESEVRRQQRREQELLGLRVEALGSAADAIMITDRKGAIVWVNAAMTVLTGYTAAELLGKNPRIFQSGRHDQAFYRNLWSTILNGQVWRGEIVNRRKDGTLFTFATTITPVPGPDGYIASFVAIRQDVTEREKAREALRQSEIRYRRLFESAQDGILLVDSESGAIQDVNPCLVQMLGYTREEMLGKKLWEVAPLRHLAASQSALQRLHEGGSLGRDAQALQTRSGNAIDVEIVSSAYLADGNRVIQCHIRDVTSRKRDERALRQEYESRKLAMELASLGAWEYRFDTGEVHWDERYRAIFGIPAETGAAPATFLARVHPDDREIIKDARTLAIAGADGGRYHREYRVVWPDGSVHWVESHGRTFFEGEGDGRRPVRFVGVAMEITERRRSEERLRQTQRLESIGTLAGGVAHDFNNLLTVIMGETSLSLVECPDCPHSQAILSASDQAADLTRQLLAYAGKGHGFIKNFDLSEVVSQAKQLLLVSVPKRVSIDFDLSKDLPGLEADRSQIEQILMNLVINAGESIRPGVEGRIEIATSSCELTPDMASRQSKDFDVEAGRYVCLEVRDNGAGMDPATAARIFEPFFSTKFTGRGLGLAAVYGIARTGKGFIDVQTTAGVGSAFRVYLPAREKAGSTEPAPDADPPLIRGLATILVVDDEAAVRRLAGTTLRRQGYDVLEASNGKHALEVLADCGFRPSVALVDLAMPVMGGDELVRVLETRWPDIKIIVSSGYLVEDAREGILSQTVVGFLQKPYTARDLAAKIGEALAGDPSRKNAIIEFPGSESADRGRAETRHGSPGI